MSNYQGRLEDSQANKLLVTPHSMANIEDSDTASQIYTVGNMLVFNNRLCKVTAAIAQGDTLEVGTNIAYKGINDIGQQLCASDGKEFYFDVKDGTYGYYPSAAKVASEFVPFGGTSPTDTRIDFDGYQTASTQITFQKSLLDLYTSITLPNYGEYYVDGVKIGNVTSSGVTLTISTLNMSTNFKYTSTAHPNYVVLHA